MREIPAVFSSEGHLLHGTFFRTSESLSERAPCVVVTGSWLNVKEQMATTWARALAERGLNTFVFDFTGWGESGGESRNLEMPTAKVRDMTQAVEFVSSMSFAGPRVGHLAVCASAQYALRAIARGRVSMHLSRSRGGSTTRRRWRRSTARTKASSGGCRARLTRSPSKSEMGQSAWSRRTRPAMSAPVCRSRWTITRIPGAAPCPRGRTRWRRRAGCTGSRSTGSPRRRR